MGGIFDFTDWRTKYPGEAINHGSIDWILHKINPASTSWMRELLLVLDYFFLVYHFSLYILLFLGVDPIVRLEGENRIGRVAFEIWDCYSCPSHIPRDDGGITQMTSWPLSTGSWIDRSLYIVPHHNIICGHWPSAP